LFQNVVCLRCLQKLLSLPFY